MINVTIPAQQLVRWRYTSESILARSRSNVISAPIHALKLAVWKYTWWKITMHLSRHSQNQNLEVIEFESSWINQWNYIDLFNCPKYKKWVNEIIFVKLTKYLYILYITQKEYEKWLWSNTLKRPPSGYYRAQSAIVWRHNYSLYMNGSNGKMTHGHFTMNGHL